MKLEAYLFFPGNAEEAMNFYKGIFGGELSLTRKAEIDPSASESDKNLLVNGSLDTGSFTLRAATGPTRPTTCKHGSS